MTIKVRILRCNMFPLSYYGVGTLTLTELLFKRVEAPLKVYITIDSSCHKSTSLRENEKGHGSFYMTVKTRKLQYLGHTVGWKQI